MPARLRDFRETDIPDALRLSRGAGWNQREEDWRALLALNPGRFVAVESEGRVVGTGGAACYGSVLAWICMILVDPSSRGAGLGTRLVQALLDCVTDVSVVGLDATPQGRSVYERLGFCEAGTVLRMEVRDRHMQMEPLPLVSELSLVLPHELLRMDREVFGADRGGTLQWLLRSGRGWLAGEESRPTGYAFLREGEHSLHVGPVVAETVDAADLLLRSALASAAERPLLIDAPAPDEEWVRRLQARGFVEKRRLTRMYRAPGRAPGRSSAVYALCGPEFG